MCVATQKVLPGVLCILLDAPETLMQVAAAAALVLQALNVVITTSFFLLVQTAYAAAASHIIVHQNAMIVPGRVHGVRLIKWLLQLLILIGLTNQNVKRAVWPVLVETKGEKSMGGHGSVGGRAKRGQLQRGFSTDTIFIQYESPTVSQVLSFSTPWNFLLCCQSFGLQLRQLPLLPTSSLVLVYQKAKYCRVLWGYNEFGTLSPASIFLYAYGAICSKGAALFFRLLGLLVVLWDY